MGMNGSQFWRGEKMKRGMILVAILLTALTVSVNLGVCQLYRNGSGSSSTFPKGDPISVEVADALEMSVIIEDGVPSSVLRGQPFNVTFTVENPNAVPLVGYICINITSPNGAFAEDVNIVVVQNCVVRCKLTIDYTVYCELGGPNGYFIFKSGTNKYVATIQIWYNKIGSYTLTAWVEQLPS